MIRHHNENMLLAWRTAGLTSYAPEKARDFMKLESLLYSERPRSQLRQSAEQQIEIFKGLMATRKR